MNNWAPKKPQLSASCKQTLRETQEMSSANSLTASQKNRSAANQARMFASNATLKGGYNALQSKLMNLGVYFKNSLYARGADSLYCTRILSRRNWQLRHIYICMFICIYKFYFTFYEHILLPTKLSNTSAQLSMLVFRLLAFSSCLYKTLPSIYVCTSVRLYIRICVSKHAHLLSTSQSTRA